MSKQLQVEVQLDSSSEPVIYKDALAVYQKGDLVCVSFMRDGDVLTDKYPIVNIFRVRHTYTGKHRTDTPSSNKEKQQ